MKNEVTKTEVEQIALQLFSERMSSSPMQNSSMAGRWAFNQAAEFLAVRDAFRSGEFEPKQEKGPKLCDCCAPNLPKNHPHNLVSQRFGELPIRGVEHLGTGMDRIAKINAWLMKNPRSEQAPIAFEELGWSVADTDLARTIFPAYVTVK